MSVRSRRRQQQSLVSALRERQPRSEQLKAAKDAAEEDQRLAREVTEARAQAEKMRRCTKADEARRKRIEAQLIREAGIADKAMEKAMADELARLALQKIADRLEKEREEQAVRDAAKRAQAERKAREVKRPKSSL